MHPLHGLTTDHGSIVDIAEYNGEAALPRHGLWEGLNTLAALALAHATPRPWHGNRAKDGEIYESLRSRSDC
jgi:hypothetical protein